MRHTNVLAILYFISGYFAAISLLCTSTFYLQASGTFVLIYLTYMLVEQLEQ